MQPPVPSSSRTETTSRTAPARRQPIRRAGGAEIRRVLIRIPDLREPAVSETPPAPPATIPLPPTYTLHQAHAPQAPHFPRAIPLHSSTSATHPQVAVAPAIPSSHDQSATTAEHRTREPVVLKASRMPAEELNGLDQKGTARSTSPLPAVHRLWQLMQRPKMIVAALLVLAAQLVWLAMLLEMDPLQPVPPTPKSTLTPTTLHEPSSLPATNPLPEGPLTTGPRGPAEPHPAEMPIITPLHDGGATSAPPASGSPPRFKNTPRLGNPQDRLPWEDSSPSPRPNAAPLAPDASAIRPSYQWPNVAGLPHKSSPKKLRLAGAIETPTSEGQR